MSDQLAHLQATLADRYAIEKELGRGGMATVYLARDLKFERQVAVKVLLPDLGVALGPERFRREIQLVTQLNHPHILPIWDSGEADGQLYYVMPFVRGESLRARLDRERQLGLQEALQVTCEVAGALDYAHRQGIVHRDIKPENILLEDGHALVADFGIARAVSAMGEQKLTQTGVTLGTPTYMSPEQAMAERDLDGRSDVYSLGCVLYEMLAGSPPFTGPTAQAVIARHTLDEVPSITIVRGTIPEDVEDAVLRALAKVPADRYKSAGEFAEAVKACQTSGGMSLGRADRRARPRRRGKAKARDRRPLVAAAALAALTLGGAGWAGWSVWGPTRSTASAAGLASLDPQPIAVLYFTDASRDKHLGYLADGITESLIEQLQQVQALNVISKGGVTPFRGTEAPRDSIARALKAGTLVEGTIDEEGGRVRAMLRLIDRSGAEFSRVPVDIPAGNALALRDTLAAEAARLLRERVGRELRMRELRAGTTDARAWSLVHQAEKSRKDGVAFLSASKLPDAGEAFDAADSLLALAAQLDGRWAKPLVMRGLVAWNQAWLRQAQRLGPQRTGEALERAVSYAEAALAVEPRSAEALEMRATANLIRIQFGLVSDKPEVDALVDRGVQDLNRAVEIAPQRASTWNMLSVYQYRKLNLFEAYNAARKAYEADAYLTAAQEIVWRLYATSYDLEQFADATRWCGEGRRRFPDDNRFVLCEIWLMSSPARDPDIPEAWRLVGELEKITPKHMWEYKRREAQIAVAAALARAQLADSARRVLERSRADATIDPRKELLPSEAYARIQLGEQDQAITLLEQYVAANPDHRAGFARASAWRWRALQTHPRFRELVALGR